MLCNFCRLSLAVIAICAGPLTALGSDFSLQLKIKPTTVKMGARITGKLTLTNTADHDIKVYIDNSRFAHPSGFSVELRDSNGNAPEMTASAGVVISSGGSRTLKPGEKVEYKVDPFNYYHITAPGIYTIQVRQVDGKGETLAESNVVTISVTK